MGNQQKAEFLRNLHRGPDVLVLPNAWDAVSEFVLNARTDIFLAEHVEPSTRFDRAVERLRAFLAAGADCVFAPGVRNRVTIERLVQAIPGPLNILATAGSPSLSELGSLGVARVSFGGGPSRPALVQQLLRSRN